jgi:hypothetical protein
MNIYKNKYAKRKLACESNESGIFKIGPFLPKILAVND